MNTKVPSSPYSNKLTYEDVKFIEKQILKLNEYQTEFSDIIYLLERGSEKIGKQSTTKVTKNKNQIL